MYQNNTTAIQNRLILSLVNFIISPVIASLISNQSCFYYLFNKSQAITTSTSIQLFFPLDSIGLTTGVSFTDQISYLPPFIYSYACGSAILAAYDPIMVCMYRYYCYSISFYRLFSFYLFI